jgi:hypothetical protein
MAKEGMVIRGACDRVCSFRFPLLLRRAAMKTNWLESNHARAFVGFELARFERWAHEAQKPPKPPKPRKDKPVHLAATDNQWRAFHMRQPLAAAVLKRLPVCRKELEKDSASWELVQDVLVMAAEIHDTDRLAQIGRTFEDDKKAFGVFQSIKARKTAAAEKKSAVYREANKLRATKMYERHNYAGIIGRRLRIEQDGRPKIKITDRTVRTILTAYWKEAEKS